MEIKKNSDEVQFSWKIIGVIALISTIALSSGLAASLMVNVSQNQDLENLEEEYNIEKALHIGNTLESYYDALRNEEGPEYNWWETTSEHWQDCADFLVTLALHDLGRLYYTSIESDYYSLTGEHSYQTAFEKIEQIAGYIECSTTSSNENIIGATLAFINEYITYEIEMNDVYHSSCETLGFKSGDCDDFSVLGATLFEYFGIESAIGIFQNAEGVMHAMILLNIDDLKGYSNYYYIDLTNKGLDSGRWVIIEPQTGISNQGIDWIEQWALQTAAELDTQDYT